MATRGGAKAIGMADALGALEVGRKADMVLFDPRHLKSFPNHDPEAKVVYASSEENVDTTIVNGSIAYRRGGFASGNSEAGPVREIAAEVEKMTGRRLSIFEQPQGTCFGAKTERPDPGSGR